MLKIVFLIVVASILDRWFAEASTPYAFLSIGDWGGAAVDDQYKQNTYDVAGQMATTASSVSAKFVINTGDNFYWCGIQNTSDYQIAVDFEEPYADASLQIPWYGSLGNHEYAYNVSAQIDYMKINPVWVMPDRYYTQRIQLADDGNNFLTILVIDTSPCVSDYRNDNPEYWDPCNNEYPTCSHLATDDDFEGPCNFHEHILEQSCDVQYNWLQTTLWGVPENDWLVVVGHHPLDEVDVKDFTTLVQQRGFSIYLNGHTHTLVQYKLDGAGAYVTTGAGAMVDTEDQEHPVTKLKKEGKHIPPLFRETYQKENSTATALGHSYETVWKETIAGFTLHTFNSDYTSLTTDFIDYQGNILNSFVVNKGGEIIG